MGLFPLLYIMERCVFGSYYEKILATGEVKCIDEEIPFEIPKGWEWCRLRDLCTVFGRIGFRGYTSNDIVEKGFGAITLSPSNMQDNGNMNYSVLSYISWEKYEESPEIKVRTNDVLIVKTGSSYGKTCIITDLPEKATINPQIAVLKYSFVNNQWLAYCLNSPFVQEQFRKYVIGTSIPTFSQEKLSSTLLPLPPKNEQGCLTKMLSLLNKWIASYNGTQQLIDRLNADIYGKLKKSILQEAIQGKLVPQIAEEGTAQELLEQIQEEKQRLVNEGKLKKSALNSSVIFKSDDNKYWEKSDECIECIDDKIPFEIPLTWRWVRHNQLFEISGGSQPPKSQFVDNPKPGYIRLYQIRDYGSNPMPVYIPMEKANKMTKEGDIILARYGASLGKVFWAKDGAYNVAMAKVIPLFESELVNKQYLFLFYQSSIYQYLVKDHSRSAQAGFNKDDLTDLFFPLPPLQEQYRIVEKYKSVASIMSK